MARPKTLKIGENGSITLKNIEPALAKAVADAVNGMSNPVVIAGSNIESIAYIDFSPPVTQAAYVVSPMTEVALGTLKNPDTGMWAVVTVTYNPTTKQARVESIEDISRQFADAVVAFKIKADEKGLV